MNTTTKKEIISNRKRVHKSICLSPQLHDKVSRLAKDEKRSFSNMVARIIEEFMTNGVYKN